ncbi:MAG TPA: carboxypeptidase-like regulatory domain-containing protein [Pyrinomonadaceae bacterium]|nr:carboxypeptidase-like regulatory domain-containing protein [Pyrinomonadaceae bacterium]
MSRFKTTFAVLSILLMSLASVAAQDKTTGSIKGRVRVETGKPSEVAVIVRQGEREIMQAMTNSKGEFIIDRLQPGLYSVTFRKPGLSVGTVNNIEVRAGKVRTLGDRLILTVDEGSIAFLRGSVFDPSGRSVPGARVEVARIEADGGLKKIADRITTETGQFAFRLPPEKARYRVTVKAGGAQDASQEITIDDAVVYRIALTLEPSRK